MKCHYLETWLHSSDSRVAQQMDSYTALVPLMINFLSSLFEVGLSYQMVNVFHSTVSAGHVPVTGLLFGQDPYLCPEITKNTVQLPKK